MSPTRWIVLLISLALAAACAAVLIRRRLGPKGTRRGMKQFARDPRARRRMTGYFEERNRLLESADSLDDAAIGRAVEGIISGDRTERHTLTQVLERIGRRAESRLLAALDDPRVRPQESVKTQGQKSPFEAVVDVLAAIGSPALIPRLLPLTRSTNEQHRKAAALAIAKVCGDAAIEPTLVALRDPAEYVRSYAMMGIIWAVDYGRVTDRFRTALFEPLARIASGEAGLSTYHDKDSARALLELDREPAWLTLSSSRCLNTANPNLLGVLRALDDAALSAPAPELRDIVAYAKARNESPWPSILVAAVGLLIRSDPAGAASEVDLLLRHQKKDIRADGAHALRRLRGLPDPYTFAGRISPELPRCAQHVGAFAEFEGEVNNGGISQYFFNSAGDNWPLALEAFEAMRAPACTSILRRAVAFIGRDGPSTDREKRIKQYARLSDKREKFLDELSGEFFADADGRQLLVTEYMTAHKAELVGAAARIAAENERHNARA